MTSNQTAALLASLSLLALAPAAQARNTEVHLPIKDVLEDPAAKAKLGDDVALLFGTQAGPAGSKDLGEAVSNRKTNAFAKSDEEACRWAMLSVLLQLVQRARDLGGDAVVEIVSYYKKNSVASETEYECHAGGLMAGVALKGRVVKLAK